MVGQILRNLPLVTGLTPKAIAMETGISVDAYYKAVKEEHRIPSEARQKLASLHPAAGMAVAYEATGYEMFKCEGNDTHLQCLITMLEKERSEADEAVKDLRFALLNIKPDSISEEAKDFLRNTAKEVVDVIEVKLRILNSLDSEFGLGLGELLQGKEKHNPRAQAESCVR